MGNENIIPNLGLPGFIPSNLAGPGDAVCSDCVSSDGSCVNNVLSSGLLTSGYYNYDISEASGFIVPKPDDGLYEQKEKWILVLINLKIFS